jgi:hypothetical protein
VEILMKKLSVWSLAGITLLASPIAMAQDKPASTPTERPAAQPAAPADAAPVVRLLDPGAEPRVKLRYAPKVGSTSALTMRMKMNTKAEFGGQEMDMNMPTMIMVMDSTVKELRPNGDIAYDAVFSTMDIEDSEDANPMMAQGMKASLNTLKGMTVSAVVSGRGETKSADFKLPPGATEQANQAMDSMKSSVNQMSAPLPEEAVGVGAKWEVVSTIKNMGLNLKQTSVMTLKELSGTSMTLDAQVTQNAEKQDMKMPGMPPGLKVELVSLKSNGSGTVKAATDSLTPIDSTMNLQSDQEMTINQGGGAPGQSMKQSIKMDLTMKSGPVKASEPAKTEPATAPK